ncbi:BREX-5 system adenine-specific DNA-methyltransferase PglX, partial [Halorubrum pallidum]
MSYRRAYEYMPEYYVNFFESCIRSIKEDGRVGMLVPRSFLFNQTLESFRSDFVGEGGSFDFLAEFGYGVLDNATVGTAGTIVRKGSQKETDGTFIRLHDINKEDKEKIYLNSAFNSVEEDIKRVFRVSLDEFQQIPGTPICYSLPSKARELHNTNLKIDPSVPGIEGTGVSDVKVGMQTGNNQRYVRKHWELTESGSRPFTNAGGDVWVLPQVDEMINWEQNGKRIARNSSARFQNSKYYEREGLTWAYIKRTGRRFGYYPKGGVFGHASNMLFAEDGLSPWLLLGALNSDLFHGLMLCLTPERRWESGYIGRLPWFRQLEKSEELEKKVQEQYELFIQQRVHDINSPYYIGPELLPNSKNNDFWYSTHEHAKLVSIEPGELFQTGVAKNTLTELAQQAENSERSRREQIENLAHEIDSEIFETLNVPSTVQDQIRQEIWLRTVEDPEDRIVGEAVEITENSEEFEEMVKDLIHHFTLVALQENSDGVIPISDVNSENNLLDEIINQFEQSFGEDADDRLIEADRVLGSRSPDEEAYPNLRAWLEDDLFDYHVSTFDRTPILWRLTSTRLVSDPTGEGFACLLDYHQLDDGLFDRLSNRYLEPRKALLRERRSAANRRRNDESLPTSEQAAAAETYTRCESGLEQIAVLEDRF